MSPIFPGVIASGISGHLSTGAYESIASYTLASSQSVITFNSIPQTYKHLELRILGRSLYSGADYDGFRIKFNNDSSASYVWHQYQSYNGNNLVVGNSGINQTSFNNIGLQANNGLTSGIYSFNVININDYTNSSKTKSLTDMAVGKKDSSAGYMQMTGGFWNSAAALTRIDMDVTTPSAYNWAVGCQFALYGIKG